MLAAEALAGLAVEAGGYYVDATFGRGGHTSLLLQALGREGRVLALDRDPHGEARASSGFSTPSRREGLAQGAFGQALYKVRRANR